LEGAKATMDGLAQFMSANPDADATMHLASFAFGQEIMVSNLGNLRFETDFGTLKLKALFGPGLLRGFENELYIRVSP
jgi:hypothetical protein